eukprot:12900637-Prorocentrum_lima.AAC.1
MALALALEEAPQRLEAATTNDEADCCTACGMERTHATCWHINATCPNTSPEGFGAKPPWPTRPCSCAAL